ncbi:prepilin-type N-terminal cleavage/methylation domain-containing protein [Symmachiella dynata]|uniref:prepilin-type N-terminal cleavage/methylation domain-containing protein n=1 Tax=Symmachiella dynata TaxID=2527995 RepID=UPI0030EB314F
MRNKHQTNNGDRRGGFTLVEMLIVIAIIAILAAITVTAIYATANSDRIRGAARQMQSAMQGAMAKAARAKKPIGIRLQLDEFDPTTVSSMIFIEQLDDFEEGTITFELDGTDYRYISLDPGANPSWSDLRSNPNTQGYLPDFTRIKILGDDGEIESTYLVNAKQVDIDGKLLITSPGATDDTGKKYKLEMGNVPLANEDALELPNGNVIDLAFSHLPNEWFEVQQVTAPFTTADPLYTAGWRATGLPPSVGGDVVIARFGEAIASNNQMDIMFSPRGVVAGPLAASGKIHLMLAEIEDTLQKRPPELAEGENIITSIYTNTGNVAAAPVDKVNAPRYYNFAETGEVAGR